MPEYIVRISLSCLIFLSLFVTAGLTQDFVEYEIDNDAHGNACLFGSDIDGDGDNDLLGSLLEDNQLILWRNEGGDPIEWTKQTIVNYFYSAHSVYAADIDGDEDQDVVGASYAGTVAWFRNDGGDPIVWTRQNLTTNFDQAHEVFVADVNGDERLDVLAVASAANLISWWRNDGGDPITWTEQTISSTKISPKSVCAADFDGDDDMDVAAASILDDKVTWWRNDGGDPIEWVEFTISNRFYGAHRVQAVDIDGDEDPDLLGAAYFGDEIAWWRNNGGDPIEWQKQNIGSGFTRACIAYATDLDGDGDQDVLGTAQDRDQIAWWRQDGNETITWTKFVIDNDLDRPWPLFACDLDGDEVPDVMSGSSHNGSNEVKWWRNNLPQTGIGDHSTQDIPVAFSLGQNYPNPFNPRTTITLHLPESVRMSLNIHDLKGRLVRTLVSEEVWESGSRSVVWDGRDDRGRDVSSGVYFYTLITGDRRETRKMILLK